MITCPICNKQFNQITNTHLKKHNLTLKEFKKQYPNVELLSSESKAKITTYNTTKTKCNKKKYNKNPNFCKYCLSKLPYEKKDNKFCSHSCAASFSNKNRKISKESKEKISATLKKYYKNNTVSEETRQKLSDNSKGRIVSNDTKQKLSDSLKKYYKTNPKPKTTKRKKKKTIIGVEKSKIYHCKCKHCKQKMCVKHPKLYCDNCLEYHSNLRTRYAFNFNVYHYPNLFDLDLLNTIGWYAPGGKSGKWNPKGLSRDHKVSVAEAIENNYDSYYITHPLNCELMPHYENQKKRHKSSISFTQLKQMVDKYDKEQ